jgi:hypothetical protein
VRVDGATAAATGGGFRSGAAGAGVSRCFATGTTATGGRGKAGCRTRGNVARPFDFEPDQLGADSQHVADLAAEGNHAPGHRRRNLDRRLVGHDVGKRLILDHGSTGLDVPFDKFDLGDALADVRHLDDMDSHLRPPSRA